MTTSSRKKKQNITSASPSDATIKQGRRYGYFLNNSVSNHCGHFSAGFENVPPISGLPISESTSQFEFYVVQASYPMMAPIGVHMP